MLLFNRKTYIVIQNNFEWGVILILIAMILNGIIRPLDERKFSKDDILIRSDSLYKSSTEKDKQLQILLNSVQVHQGFVVQFDIASESLSMQGRLLFITLFSALIAVLYSEKFKKNLKFITSISLLVGFLWYGINIHTMDIENRRKPANELIFNTELFLLSIPPWDSRIYNINFEKVRIAMEKEKEDHQWRKIKRFITPDFSDIVFNMIPLLVFSFLYMKRNKITD